VSPDRSATQTAPEQPEPAEPSTETELKLRFPHADLSRILRSALLRERQIGERRERRLVSTYYDTDDLALSTAGTIIRIRVQGDRLIQTIKTQDSNAGGVAPERGEWEWDVTDKTLDLSRLDAVDPATASLIRNTADRLKPIFATEIERVEFRVALSDGGRAIAAIDDGRVRSGHKTERVSELELELESGSVGSLFGLAIELANQLPLTISLETKSSVGYRLAAGSAPEPAKAKPIQLTTDMSAGLGFRWIVQSCLTHLLENQIAVLHGIDVGGIHQMRVALRRMRAAIKLFEDLLPADQAELFNEQLRATARLFGEARDLDVLATDLVPHFARHAKHDEDARLLAEAIEPYRSDAHARVTTEIGTRAYTRLILSLASWAAQESQSAPSGRKSARRLDRKLVDTAPDLLDQRLAAALKRGRYVAEAEARQRHALRKALKKLRYGAEFLSSLYPPHAVSDYLGKLEDLQDRLGELNDAAMALDVLPGLVPPSDAALTRACEALEKTLDRKAARGLEELADAWSRFKSAEPFWRPS
jgi:inorganic triphosphatase YgiF